MLSFFISRAGLFAMGGIAGAVILVAVWMHGYRTSSTACEAEKWQARYENIRRQLLAHELAAQADREVLEASRKETERLKGISRELAAKISDGVCFGADDVDRLRELWGGSAK